MIHMNIEKTVFNAVSLRKVMIAGLLMAVLALFHSALVSALLSLGFLDAAESLSINNPDVAEAQATRYRILAVELAEAETQGGDGIQQANQPVMTAWQAQIKSRDYWLEAIRLRPMWPYYY